MLKDDMDERQVNWHLFPPGMHIRNDPERAIKTFNNHFKAGLDTTNELLPMHLWCIILPHACTTINIMRNSIMNPKMSAEAQLNGVFYYNRNPLSPPRTKSMIHKDPGPRKLEIFRELRDGTLGARHNTTDVGPYMSPRWQQIA